MFSTTAADGAGLASPPASPILCLQPGCDKVFDSKDARKEHQFQYHSSPRIKFSGRSDPQYIKRDADGYLRCLCSAYKVLTVGGMKRHGKKCPGTPRFAVVNPEELPYFCVAEGCEKRYKTKNALAVHVYEYHSSPKIRHVGQEDAKVMQRAPDGYLSCPCGAYRVITTAAMLKHCKLCDGTVKTLATPTSTPISTSSTATPKLLDSPPSLGPSSGFENINWANCNWGQFVHTCATDNFGNIPRLEAVCPSEGSLTDGEASSPDNGSVDIGLDFEAQLAAALQIPLQPQSQMQPQFMGVSGMGMMSWNDELYSLYLDLIE
ncbi:hypothetical protein BC830DRAFT_1115376 [Chytriomyces sp. MP71]|nr:hypothetical protein BC830DRAFT_1115376 [Chytriomyces sp. MP71]